MNKIDASLKIWDEVFDKLSKPTPQFIDEYVSEENKEHPMHGSKQDPIDEKIEEFYSSILNGRSHQFAIRHIDDPWLVLGQWIEIIVKNPGCDVGMELKKRVQELMEQAAED